MINGICIGRINWIDAAPRELQIEGEKKSTVFGVHVVYSNGIHNNYAKLEFWNWSYSKFVKVYQKGDLIQAMGQIKVSPYCDKNGKPKASLVIVNPYLQKISLESLDNGTQVAPDASEAFEEVTPVSESLDF